MKRQESTQEKLFKFDQAYSKKYKSPLLKWFQTTMTPEEKYKLGLMTYPEYEEWQKELAKEAAKENEAASGSTFWANDDGDRETISSDEYADFLSQNNINVANRAAVDVESLLAEHGEESAIKNEPPTPDMDEILANVSRDLHGGQHFLSEKEIAALFEAANSANNQE